MKKLCKHAICYPIIEKYGGCNVGYKCRINFDECPDNNDKNCKEFIGYKPEEIIFNFNKECE